MKILYLFCLAILSSFALPAHATSYNCAAGDTGEAFSINVTPSEIGVTQPGNSYTYVFRKEGNVYKASGDFSEAPESIDEIKSFENDMLRYTVALDTSGTETLTAKCSPSAH